MRCTSKVVIVRPCQPGPFLFPCFRDGKIPTFIVCIPGGSGALCIGFYSICKEFMFHESALSFKLDSINLNSKWNSVWSIQPLELVRNSRIGLDFLQDLWTWAEHKAHKTIRPESLSLGSQKKGFAHFCTYQASSHCPLDLCSALPKWPQNTWQIIAFISVMEWVVSFLNS